MGIGEIYPMSFKNPAARRQYQRTYYSRQEQRLKGVRASAKRRGLEFALTQSDIVWSTHCPLLGITLNYSASRGAHNSPSIDRINNDRGYVPGNVCVISRRANGMKGDITNPSIFRRFADYMEGKINAL
jgi:hypothetical protein